MSRQEVQEVFDLPAYTFFKLGELVDAFFGNSFQVFYDASEQHAEYIEVSKSAEFTVLYKGINVFTLPADELISLIANDSPFDPTDPELGYSYVFPDLELACWRPILPEGLDDNEGRFFATVGIGTKGYFSAPRTRV